jgi:DnaJ-domain-containing protein 1
MPRSSPRKTRSGEAAEARNNADSLVHATERQLEEHGDKIDASLKAEIEAAIAETRTAIEGGNPDDMNAKTQALTEKAMKLGQAITRRNRRPPLRRAPMRRRPMTMWSTPSSRKSTTTRLDVAMKRTRHSRTGVDGGDVGRFMATADYYELLEIERTADDKTIKSSFRRLAMRFHPDKNPVALILKPTKQINEAYACLSDPQKRAAYDQYGHAAFQQGGGGGGWWRRRFR